MAFGPEAFASYMQGHIDGRLMAGVEESLRVAAFMQAQRELESAMGSAIPAADSVLGARVRLDFACYELAMYLIKCAATPGSGGAVPLYLAQSSGDAEAAEARPDPNRWPQSVWRWLGGYPGVMLSRG
jgi:hypothetical protein